MGTHSKSVLLERDASSDLISSGKPAGMQWGGARHDACKRSACQKEGAGCRATG